jgi:polar amino acid transport system substrate-binding protein
MTTRGCRSWPPEDSGGLKRIEDFNSPSVAIRGPTGTTAAASVQRFMPKAKAKLFDDESQAIQELLLGRVHAVVASAPCRPSRRSPIRTGSSAAEGAIHREPIGFAVRKGDPDSLNILDNWIRVVEAGVAGDRKRYWFETKDWERLLK